MVDLFRPIANAILILLIIMIIINYIRLGLERSSNAEEAFNVITQLLEKYGQGGPCSKTDESFCYHNSFLIADPRSAWILETSGKHWVGHQVKSRFCLGCNYIL